jgi:outer membrane biosynthesis protein TonB
VKQLSIILAALLFLIVGAGCHATGAIANGDDDPEPQTPVEETTEETVPEVASHQEETAPEQLASTNESPPAPPKQTLPDVEASPAPPEPAPSEPAPDPAPVPDPWVQGQIDWMNTAPEEKATEREANSAAREAAQHAAQSQAANKGGGEGANFCGIMPDATYYGKPC